MPTIDFERLDWEDYPSTETPLSAENLNRLEDAMEGIYDDVGGQEQAISNILGNFAYVEPTAVASKDYLAGDLLVRGDYMYKAIIPIQTDDALVEGTNITKTTVSSELGVDVFSNFAYIERSNVATKNYTVGSHVLLNNILYVVTSAVETGENLVVDMNIEQTTVCDELEKETGSVASAVGYDNTTSGLTATNVQDAVDEVSSAGGVSYDNTESGLTATNVQGALNEVCSNFIKSGFYSTTLTISQYGSAQLPNIKTTTATPIIVLLGSNSYPNGLSADITFIEDRYWIIAYETSSRTLIRNVTVTAYVFYMY